MCQPQGQGEGRQKTVRAGEEVLELRGSGRFSGILYSFRCLGKTVPSQAVEPPRFERNSLVKSLSWENWAAGIP